MDAWPWLQLKQALPNFKLTQNAAVKHFWLNAILSSIHGISKSQPLPTINESEGVPYF